MTLPSKEMLASIADAKLGDAGRLDIDGRGEDQTTNELEDLARDLVGMDEAVLFSSGTLANTVALLTHCKPGDKVLVDESQHIYKSEKAAFLEDFGQLKPVFYKLTKDGVPDIDNLKDLIGQNEIKLLIIENSHNFAGGTCIDLNLHKEIYRLAKENNVPVHMDGARLFNAAISLGVSSMDICQYVDSIMFCLSKGLGAPLGSLLCGEKGFIKEVRRKKKFLGANMRQSGIIAAPGIYALENNIDKLRFDHDNARFVAENLKCLKRVKIQENVETNILMLDLSNIELSTEEYCQLAKEKGLLIRPVLDRKVRMVFYNGITRKDAKRVVEIIKEIDSIL